MAVPCTEAWTASDATNEETTKVFNQAGVCQHEIVEMFAEMHRSEKPRALLLYSTMAYF